MKKSSLMVVGTLAGGLFAGAAQADSAVITVSQSNGGVGITTVDNVSKSICVELGRVASLGGENDATRVKIATVSCIPDEKMGDTYNTYKCKGDVCGPYIPFPQSYICTAGKCNQAPAGP